MQKSQELTEPGKARQWIATSVVNLLSLSYGMVVGWCSPIIPRLMDENNPIVGAAMTEEQISWLTGILCISGLGMTPFLGGIAEKLGRKMTGFIIAIPMVIGWTLNIFAYNAVMLLIARFFVGIGGAGMAFLAPLYVAEISSLNMRGTLSSMMVLILNTGILVAFVLGAYVNYNWFNVICLAVPVVFVGAFTLLPETPIYLVRRNRLDDATRSLLWLRGGNKFVAERELALLQNEVKEAENISSASFSDLFKDKATRMGLIISIVLMVAQQVSGIIAVLSYSSMIFEISGSSLSPDMGSIIIGVIQVIGSYMSTILIDRLGRRSLLLISTLGSSFCLLILALYCYLQSLEYNMSSFSWIPVTSLSIYMIAYCLGFGPCPFIVSAEIFRRDISSMANSVSLLFLWFSAFLVVYFFSTLVFYTGIHGSFLFFAICCALAFVFTFIFIPETKGQPLEYILAQLSGNVENYVEKKSSIQNKNNLVLNPI